MSNEAIYVDGILHRRALAGIRPSYGYPPCPLPDTRAESREIESCFFAARRAAAEEPTR